MEYRFLRASGFKVPVLGFGAGTFSGKGPLFSAWGNTDVDEAKPVASAPIFERTVDFCCADCRQADRPRTVKEALK